MREVTFRLWAFWRFLMMGCVALGCIPHRVRCRAEHCDPWDHLPISGAFRASWTVWSPEMIRGPHARKE